MEDTPQRSPGERQPDGPGLVAPDVYRLGPVPPPNVLICVVCGSYPAADVRFRAATGFAIVYIRHRVSGPFCVDCGLAMFRYMTTKTLAGGFFSIIPIVFWPFYLAWNLYARVSVLELEEPRRHPNARHVQSPYPLDPGPPVFRRPASYATVGLYLLIALVNVIWWTT